MIIVREQVMKQNAIMRRCNNINRKFPFLKRQEANIKQATEKSQRKAQ
jgi:hypothetical protein